MKHLLQSTLLIALFLASSVVSAQDFGEDYFEGTFQPSEVWDGSFAFGLNGKSGNSENLDINLDLNMSREDDLVITNLLMTYFYSRNALGTSTDRFFGEARQERKLANPNFTWYYSGSYEWDRFKSFDYRLAFHSGLGMVLYEYEDRSLKGRVGAGTSREFGGANDDWIPELALGLDWERQLTARTNLFATVDFFPSFEDFNDYRLNTRAGFETLLDEALDMKLRTFVFNRYDSTPGPGFNANDIEYGLSLVFGF